MIALPMAVMAGGAGGVSAAAAGKLQLVESKIIAADVASVTFSGLDGDTDELYLLLLNLYNNSAGAAFYTVRPNGLTTNQDGYFATFAAAYASSARSDLLVAGTNQSGVDVLAAAWITGLRDVSGTAKRRQVLSWWTEKANGGAYYPAVFGGSWTDTATQLTSLEVQTGSSNGIGDGSRLDLYRVKP